MVESARSAAFARTVSARLRTVGVVAPGPPGWGDTASVARLEARFLAQRMFSWPNPNMSQVAEILSTMITHLSPGMRHVNEPAADQYCRRNWDAYVVDRRPPVHLCPSFYRSSAEQRVRTLVHEAAHLAGIGEAEGESYCMTFDCEAGCGPGFDAADSWSHYVHCLSSQPADRPTTITAPRPRPRPQPSPGSR